jgi:capsular exopolysaccharide synthesis family protein
MNSEPDGLTPATDTSAGGMPHFLLGLAWRRKWNLVLPLIVGLVAGVLAWAQEKPTYSSSATVLVTKKRPNAIPVSPVDSTSVEDYEDFLTTHMVLLKSPVILERAARKLDRASLPSLAGERVPIDRLQGSLTVNRERPKDANPFGNNQVLRLTVSGWSADESPVVLSAVVDSYKDFLAATYQDSSGETVRLIVEARELLDKDLAKKAAEYREFRQNTPLLWKGKDGVSLYQETLAAAQSKRARLQLRRAEILGQIAALEDVAQNGRSPEEVAAVLAAFPRKDDVHKGLAEQLLPLLLEEQILLESFGADHPKVKLVRQQIATARELFGQPRPSNPQADQRVQPMKTVEGCIQALQAELDAITTVEKSVAELFAHEHDAARKLTNYDLQDELLRADLARIQHLYDSILKRLQEVNLVKGLGGFEARLISPPSIQGEAATSLIRFLMKYGFGGLLAGFLFAYLADVTDKRFRTPEEISNSLRVPVVGHIPLWRGSAAQVPANAASPGRFVDPALCSHSRPRSVEAEAYRAVRTALYFNTRGKTHKVIQITSPESADGKTALASNLAVSIAQSGKTVILIDADFRRPRLHKIFGIANQVGLSSVINGTTSLANAIQESGVPGLVILPSGAMPPNPAELLTSPRFEELLDAIRRDYDFVLIDTPPLLPVTDACVVAPRVDGVLLTIRISKNRRPQTERAKELLDALQVSTLGVVVNAVDRSFGYGSYYRYYQSYGYYSGSAHAEDSALPDVKVPRRALPGLNGQECKPER